MESNKKYFLLLLYHDRQFLLLFLHVIRKLFILSSTEHSLHFLRLLLEFFDSNHITFDFMFNDFHSGVADLVSRQKLMKLCKVAVSLENVEQIQR